MGGQLPKQYLALAGLTILEHTIRRLFQCVSVEHVYVVLHPDDQYGKQLLRSFGSRITVVAGGAERADSVLNGLLALQGLAADNDWALIHDAARPCFHPSDVNRLMLALADHKVGGLLGVPVADTLKRVRSDLTVESTVPRDKLWRAYTPQVFRYGLLVEAMNWAQQSGQSITDEASAVEASGHAPLMVEGSPDNIKVTHPHDLLLAELYLQHQTNGSAT